MSNTKLFHILDTRFDRNSLVAEPLRYDFGDGEQFVSWDTTEAEEGLIGVGDGIAFIPPDYEPYGSRSKLTLGTKDEHWHEYTFAIGNGTSLLILLILPKNYVVSSPGDVSPRPIATKVHKNRMALVFYPHSDLTRIKWHMNKVAKVADVKSGCKELRLQLSKNVPKSLYGFIDGDESEARQNKSEYRKDIALYLSVGLMIFFCWIISRQIDKINNEVVESVLKLLASFSVAALSFVMSGTMSLELKHRVRVRAAGGFAVFVICLAIMFGLAK